MNTLRIGLAVLLGLVLGLTPFRTSAVRAQENGNVLVFIRPVLVLDQKLPISKSVSGTRVDGLSCIPKPSDKLPDAAVCYVATTN